MFIDRKTACNVLSRCDMVTLFRQEGQKLWGWDYWSFREKKIKLNPFLLHIFWTLSKLQRY